MKSDPRLIVGIETSDDAGVFLLNDDTALIQSIDFFTPTVDDPRDFGRIAAANALSDIYAMGGIPLTAMNIVCFPSNDLPESVLGETIAGGLEKIHEAGAFLVGGHSIDDDEFKYGLSVTGIVRPQDILTNAGAKTGDSLILTKPVGTGVLATTIKAKLADTNEIETMVRISSGLNRTAAEVMREFEPSACTDISGFGLAGHLLEMARASKKVFRIDTAAIPFIPEALSYARMGLFPAGTYNNKSHFLPHMDIAPGLDPIITDMLFDPQTSGGLVISLPGNRAGACIRELGQKGVDAAIIGEVAGKEACGHLMIR